MFWAAHLSASNWASCLAAVLLFAVAPLLVFVITELFACAFCHNSYAAGWFTLSNGFGSLATGVATFTCLASFLSLISFSTEIDIFFLFSPNWLPYLSTVLIIQGFWCILEDQE